MISIWGCHFLNALNQTEKKLDAKIPLGDEKVWRSIMERKVFQKKQVIDLLEIEFYSSTDITDSSTSNNGLINKLTNSHSNFVDSKLICKQISQVNYNIANINPKMKEDYVFEDEQDMLEVVGQFGSTFLESYRWIHPLMELKNLVSTFDSRLGLGREVVQD
jgi:hypothetical protein